MGPIRSKASSLMKINLSERERSKGGGKGGRKGTERKREGGGSEER